MTIPKKDEPAFPLITASTIGPNGMPENAHQIYGLTKREYFAGLAMQGLVSDSPEGYVPVAINAVRYADALLKELEK